MVERARTADIEQRLDNRLPLIWRAAARGILLAVAALLSTVVLFLVVCSLFQPGTDVVTLVGTMVWSMVGPVLVLGSILAVCLAASALFLVPKTLKSKLAETVVIFSVIAVLTSSWITLRIVRAGFRQGATINLSKSIFSLGQSSRSSPDRKESYAVVDHTPQEAWIYEPRTISTYTPVLMYIHGGGWRTQSAKDTGAAARWFADQGWLVVNVNYRLATRKHATWDEAPADVACALTWTVQFARSLNINVNRLTVIGESAGGNLALNLGWSASQGKAVSSCPSAGPVPVPNAIVTDYPPADMADAYVHGRTWLYHQHPQDILEEYIGGKPSQHPDRMAAVSADTYIAPNDPPTLFIQPESDDFVPAPGNEQFVARAQKAGARITLVRIPVSHHAFDSLPNSLGWQIKMSIVRKWLSEQGLGPG